jgi:phage gpG-like protein
MIEIDVQFLAQTIGTIEGIGQRAQNIAPVARNVALVCQADVDERFNSSPGVRSTGTVYGGATWERLSESYLKSNPRREGGRQLRDSGQLLQSFQVGKRGNIVQGASDSIVFGSSLPKARYNQRRRPMLFVHPELVRQVARTIELYLVKGVT